MLERRIFTIRLLAHACLPLLCLAQIDGSAAYQAFKAWEKSSATASLPWPEVLRRYASRLETDRLSKDAIEKTIRIIDGREEAALYDKIYTAAPKFNVKPNQLLTEAVEAMTPGNALDAGMGQGRNAIYLAQKGWDVTGFDVSGEGLSRARGRARKLNLHLTAQLLSSEEFDFGTDRWDLIAILYAIEKHSVFQVRKALKPGGVVVIEESHKEAGGKPFEYDTNELLKIFDGFRILKYEDTIAVLD